MGTVEPLMPGRDHGLAYGKRESVIVMIMTEASHVRGMMIRVLRELAAR